jgi:anti-sigma factor RsiW
MMECASASERLGAWFDGELPGAQADAVRAHVETCPICADECRQMKLLESALRSALAAEASRLAPEPFWRGVQQKVVERSAWPAGLSPMRAAFAGPKLVWAIPVVIVALIGVLSVDWRTPPWTPSVQQNGFVSVESIDPHGRNVAVFREDESKTTVIWLYHNPEGEDEASSEGTGSSSPTF